jgi:hypothetical protein
MLRAYSATNHLPIHLGAIVEPLSQEVAGNIGKVLWLLFAAVLGLLLIACVNLASLQLARATVRERDNAVRAALGAGRMRLFQAALMESVVLSLTGGALGVLLAFGGILFAAIAPENLPRLHEIHVTWPVLLFACGISGIAALLSGTLPALRSLRSNPQRALQSRSTRIANTGQTSFVRRLLITFEIARTVVLLIVSGLVVRSFSRVLNQPHDFNANHVVLAEVDLFSPRYDQSNGSGDSARSEFIDRMLDKIHSTPGVEFAAITSTMPLSGDNVVHSMYRPDHPLPESEVPTANLRNVSPGYFATMQTKLIAGHDFTASERSNPQSAIISQRAAQAAWPDSHALGRKFKFDGAFTRSPESPPTRASRISRKTSRLFTCPSGTIRRHPYSFSCVLLAISMSSLRLFAAKSGMSILKPPSPSLKCSTRSWCSQLPRSVCSPSFCLHSASRRCSSQFSESMAFWRIRSPFELLNSAFGLRSDQARFRSSASFCWRRWCLLEEGSCWVCLHPLQPHAPSGACFTRPAPLTPHRSLQA